jgi:hypothetical protein
LILHFPDGWVAGGATVTLAALTDLSGRWIDRVHARRPREGDYAGHGLQCQSDLRRARSSSLQNVATGPIRVILIRPPRRPRKTNRWPECGSRRSASWPAVKRSNYPFNVYPVWGVLLTHKHGSLARPSAKCRLMRYSDEGCLIGKTACFRVHDGGRRS